MSRRRRSGLAAGVVVSHPRTRCRRACYSSGCLTRYAWRLLAVMCSACMCCSAMIATSARCPWLSASVRLARHSVALVRRARGCSSLTVNSACLALSRSVRRSGLGCRRPCRCLPCSRHSPPRSLKNKGKPQTGCESLFFLSPPRACFWLE